MRRNSTGLARVAPSRTYWPVAFCAYWPEVMRPNYWRAVFWCAETLWRSGILFLFRLRCRAPGGFETIIRKFAWSDGSWLKTACAGYSRRSSERSVSLRGPAVWRASGDIWTYVYHNSTPLSSPPFVPLASGAFKRASESIPLSRREFH